MNGFDITNNVNLSSPEAVRQIWSYVLSLQEQVEYWLRNLDAENFNETGLKEIAGMFKADTIISNTNITQEIYAQYGNIANLTVDKLRTDYKKAQMYLKGDKGDVNYIYIHDETISFITAATDGSASEQLVDGDRKFYWEDDTHAQMTSEKVTDYPVMVFKYSEMVKAKIAFQEISLADGTSTVMPVLTLGVGASKTNSEMIGKSYIYKNLDGLYIDYWNAADELRRIKLGEDGITITPPTIILPDATNAAAIEASAATTMQGIDVTFTDSTKLAFMVQMDVTASAAMSLTVEARIAGKVHRHCTKYFAAAGKDCVSFSGIFDSVEAGTKTVDVVITPSAGTASIALKDYRLSLIVRSGTAKEAAPWPMITTADAIKLLTVADAAATLAMSAQNDGALVADTLRLCALSDSAVIALS